MSSSNNRRAAAMTRSLVCTLAALAVATASCSSMHQVPVIRTIAGQPAWQVKAGDTVRVTLRDEGVTQFRVQSVTPDAIVANDGTRFEQTNITSVQRRAISSNKTAGAVVFGVIAIGLIAAVGHSIDFVSCCAGWRD